MSSTSDRYPRTRPEPQSTPAEHGQRALDADTQLDPLAEPGLVTVAGDWHGQEGFSRWAIRDAARSGSKVVVHTGDFGIWSGRSGELFLDMVEKTLAHTDTFLIFVDGNHEDFSQLGEYPLSARHGLRCVRPRLYHAPRGFRWTWAGLTWLALGGATSLDRPRRTIGVDWWPQEELTWADAERAIDGGPADVMVTHDCPVGVTIPGLPPASTWNPSELHRAYGHRMLLRQVVDEVRPTHLVHGHFHSRYTAELDLGSGLSCQVTGLDRDGTMTKAQLHLDLDVLTAQSWARRHDDRQARAAAS